MSSKKRAIGDSSDDEELKFKSKVANPKKSKTEGNKMFELGGRKKVSVGEFQGKLLVNIREFYEDKSTGEEKPGNKGIALNVEQWNNLMKQIFEIDNIVKGVNNSVNV